jgi:hypothetical protein
LGGAFGAELGFEGLAMFGDAVDGEQQFVHAGDQGDFGQLAAGAQPLVMSAQPWVVAHGTERGHPQRGAQLGIADGGEASARSLPFARLLEAGDGTDISGERAGAAEVDRVADGTDDAGRHLRADAVDGSQHAADLMLAQLAVEVVIELAQAAAQQVEVLAGVAHLQAVRGPVMVADRTPSGVDEGTWSWS